MGARSTPSATHACEVCAQTFSWKQNLTRHILSVHKLHRNFSCDTCTKTFTAKSDLEEHVATVHATENMISCEHCDKRFTHKGMPLHMSRAHNISKKHQCDVCSRCFSRPSKLSRHVLSVHQRQKHHKCHTCERSFALAEHLKRHQSHCRAAPRVPTTKFTCEVCKGGFRTKSDFNLHRLNKECDKLSTSRDESSCKTRDDSRAANVMLESEEVLVSNTADEVDSVGSEESVRGPSSLHEGPDVGELCLFLLSNDLFSFSGVPRMWRSVTCGSPERVHFQTVRFFS